MCPCAKDCNRQISLVIYGDAVDTSLYSVGQVSTKFVISFTITDPHLQ
jgi:hypothetical protein